MEVYINNLRYKTGGFDLEIEGLNLKDGNIYGILGPNGSGKSTFLKILSGKIKDIDGSIKFNIEEENPYTKISVLSQKPYIFNCSVEDNIKMSVKWAKADLDNFNNIVEILELKDLLKRNATNLSGGEMQRVAVARVLSQDKGLILLDEPTASIDPINTRIIEKAILNSKKNDRCIVVVTHNIYQALRICDKIIFINKGRIVEEIDKESTKESNIINEYLLYTSS
ncbi:ATP-binding cassette domain-containing protein [Thermobrachium celere]|uniref:ABC-type tungstate transport system, ATP-binding protein n=1 Tax=Thermobrachium celere DSM 8682 TaxID=941824 RepID=R7RV49_9CLOT|nr:ATP-binding cassette domain-containing protein [Thermobrachium celere]CDF59410.1 ABC-type tungstate transport system, ATP-binding protein [Thermobrachium celere DSM 8682]